MIWGLSLPTDKVSKCASKKDRMTDLKSLQLLIFLLKSDLIGMEWGPGMGAS